MGVAEELLFICEIFAQEDVGTGVDPVGRGRCAVPQIFRENAHGGIPLGKGVLTERSGDQSFKQIAAGFVADENGAGEGGLSLLELAERGEKAGGGIINSIDRSQMEQLFAEALGIVPLSPLVLRACDGDGEQQ